MNPADSKPRLQVASKVRPRHRAQEAALSQLPERAPRIAAEVRQQPCLGAGEDVAHMPMALNRGPDLALRRLAALADHLLELIENDRHRLPGAAGQPFDAIQHLGQDGHLG